MNKRRLFFYFLPFWLIVSGLLVFRLGYDLKTWCFGSTVVVRSNGFQYDYLLRFPRGYHDFTGPRPLIVYLHGAGSVGKDINVLRERDIFFIANGTVSVKDFPFIVISPITPKHGWDSKRVITFLDEFLKNHRFRYQIDTSRIYLTGFSMGGFGTFSVACDYPDSFAAIVPLAGGCDPEKAEKLLTVPTWAFHGDADEAVAYENSKNMIDTMKELNHPNVQLTTLHGADHGIPELVYTKPELYRWLLEHKKAPIPPCASSPLQVK